MPIWFRFFIGFILCLIVGVLAVYVWAGYEIIQAGPEGIGEFFGKIVSGFDATQGDR